LGFSVRRRLRAGVKGRRSLLSLQKYSTDRCGFQRRVNYRDQPRPRVTRVRKYAGIVSFAGCAERSRK
jgi:hypothetical protein